MLKGLVGKNIVIGGSRKIVEISTLIEKQGELHLVADFKELYF